IEAARHEPRVPSRAEDRRPAIANIQDSERPLIETVPGLGSIEPGEAGLLPQLLGYLFRRRRLGLGAGQAYRRLRAAGARPRRGQDRVQPLDETLPPPGRKGVGPHGAQVYRLRMREVQPRPSALQALRRGLRHRCPRCGEGPLFAGWNRLYDECPVCGLAFERRSGDTWFFMYMSTAGLTGMLVVTM